MDYKVDWSWAHTCCWSDVAVDDLPHLKLARDQAAVKKGREIPHSLAEEQLVTTGRTTPAGN